MEPSHTALSVRLATGFSIALIACRHPPAPPPTPAPTHATAPDATAVAATPVDAGSPPLSVCDRALTPHRATRATAVGDAAWSEALDSFGKCLPTPRGAWVVALDSLTPSDPDAGDVHLDGVWSVQRVDASGAVARARRETSWTDYNMLRVEHASAFDYDGDGEAEIVLYTNESAHESADSPHGEVLTFRDGAVVAYAPAAGIEPTEARDVDQDGRPDLLTVKPYDGEGDDSPSGFTYNMSGPQLVAHAVAGGQFSRDDDVAKRAARAVCPQRVANVFGATASQENAAAAVVCARIWGVPAATVAREIARRCATEDESGSPSENPRRPRCGDVRVLTRWARLTPPVTLP